MMTTPSTRLNATLLALTTADDWAHGSHAAVDVAMLARYYERYADHCVNVCARIVFWPPENYPKVLSSAVQHRLRPVSGNKIAAVIVTAAQPVASFKSYSKGIYRADSG